MPKMKTHRGAAKRLRRTASGRWARSRSGKSHILTKKDSKRKRRLRKKTLVSGSDQKRMTALLPDR